MTDTKHTPTPWIIEYGHMQQHTDIRYWQITDGQDAICNNQFCFAHDSEANAAHIVKCVNMHEELVEALKEILIACEDDCGMPSEHDEDDEAVGSGQDLDGSIKPMSLQFGHMRRAREALKKAGAL